MKQNLAKYTFFLGEAQKKSECWYRKKVIGRKIKLLSKVWNKSNNRQSVMTVEQGSVFFGTKKWG